jgi:hypothetical protein
MSLPAIARQSLMLILSFLALCFLMQSSLAFEKCMEYPLPTVEDTLSVSSFYSIITSSGATGNSCLLVQDAQKLRDFIKAALPRTGTSQTLGKDAIISWQMLRDADIQQVLDLKRKEVEVTFAPAATLLQLQKLIQEVCTILALRMRSMHLSPDWCTHIFLDLDAYACMHVSHCTETSHGGQLPLARATHSSTVRALLEDSSERR